MTKIEWKPQYETGIPIIDEQHKRLFARLDAVQRAVVQGSPREEIGDLLQSLMAETVEHFRTEEAIMAQHGFPDLLAHIREHELLTEKLGELAQRFEDSQDAMALLVTTFMGGVAAPPHQRGGPQLRAFHKIRAPRLQFRGSAAGPLGPGSHQVPLMP